MAAAGISDRVEVRHDPEQQRFVIEVGGVESGSVLRYRRLSHQTLEYYSTYTPPALRGHGFAGRLASAALDYALEHDYRVVPTCPFVAGLIDRTPRYQGLAA